MNCVRKKASDEPEKPEPDRNEEKGDFDGTEGSLRTDSVDTVCPQTTSEAAKPDRDLSNRPEAYKRTGVAGTPLYHPCDDSKIHGRIIEKKAVHTFSLQMFLVEECFELAHYVEPGKKPRWGYFPTTELLQAIAY